MGEPPDFMSKIKRKGVGYRVKHAVQAGKAGLGVMRADSPRRMFKGDSNGLAFLLHREHRVIPCRPYASKKNQELLMCYLAWLALLGFTLLSTGL